MIIKVDFFFIATLSGNLADQPLIWTITKRLCYIGHVRARKQMRPTLNLSSPPSPYTNRLFAILAYHVSLHNFR